MALMCTSTQNLYTVLNQLIVFVYLHIVFFLRRPKHKKLIKLFFFLISVGFNNNFFRFVVIFKNSLSLYCINLLLIFVNMLTNDTIYMRLC